MLMSRRGPDWARSALKVECLVGALVAASIGFPAAHAATFGHSRIVSGVGQPLHIEIPVTELTEQEIQTLRARPAPAQAWRDAGMSPPVALESMRLALLDGYRPGMKLIQLRSEQAFEQPIVDVLIDVQSASGQQRYQVSLVASADTNAVRLPGEQQLDASGRREGAGALGNPGQADIAGRQIRVRQRDTMFAVAQRNAVPGVTVYQMMMGLQRANPKAFIENNVNLVRADAVLTMPDLEALTALSDREARRLFLQHVEAFNQYRRRGNAAGSVAVSTSGPAVAQGELSSLDEGLQPDPGTSAAPEDRLRLSAGPAQSAGADNARAAAGRTANGGNPASANGLAGDSGNPATAGAGSRSGRSPSGNLIASSGVIATDAMPDRRPHAVSSDAAGERNSFSSGVASGGTALQADGASTVDPDDEAALRKGVAESQSRIIELEDNVRHLNEALQKQGHVAAETALEGVRGVGEVIKEIIKLVDPEEGTLAGTEADPSGTAGISADSAAGAGASAAGSAAGDGDRAGPGSGSATRSGAASGNTSAAGSGVASSTGVAAGEGEAPIAASASAPGGSASGSNANAQGGNAIAPGSAPVASTGAGNQSRATSVGSTAGNATPAEPSNANGGSSTTQTGNEPSWFKENMIAVVGGGLALIIVLAVWLLRRAGRPRDDVFESDSPITDTMVREKLRNIDLDLDNPPEPGRSRR